MINQHTVATVGDIERDVFVRLFGAGSAITVPGFHRLTVTHQRSEAFPQTVYRFTDTEIQPLKHVATVGVGILYIAVIFQLATGNAHTIAQKIERPEFPFGNANTQITALQLGIFTRVLHLHRNVMQHINRVMRTAIQRPLKMLNPHANHTFLR